jgi:hypothetical protein
MLSTYLAIQTAVLLAAGGSEAVTDAHLVGTWKPNSKTFDPPHGIATITYNADHTCIHEEPGEYGSIAHGTWRLHGRQLITSFGKDLVVRETVLSATVDQFKTRAPDGVIWTYTRVKGKRRSASNQTMERTADRCVLHF